MEPLARASKPRNAALGESPPVSKGVSARLCCPAIPSREGGNAFQTCRAGWQAVRPERVHVHEAGTDMEGHLAIGQSQRACQMQGVVQQDLRAHGFKMNGGKGCQDAKEGRRGRIPAGPIGHGLPRKRRITCIVVHGIAVALSRLACPAAIGVGRDEREPFQIRARLCRDQREMTTRAVAARDDRPAVGEDRMGVFQHGGPGVFGRQAIFGQDHAQAVRGQKGRQGGMGLGRTKHIAATVKPDDLRPVADHKTPPPAARDLRQAGLRAGQCPEGPPHVPGGARNRAGRDAISQLCFRLWSAVEGGG